MKGIANVNYSSMNVNAPRQLIVTLGGYNMRRYHFFSRAGALAVLAMGISVFAQQNIPSDESTTTTTKIFQKKRDGTRIDTSAFVKVTELNKNPKKLSDSTLFYKFELCTMNPTKGESCKTMGPRELYSRQDLLLLRGNLCKKAFSCGANSGVFALLSAAGGLAAGGIVYGTGGVGELNPLGWSVLTAATAGAVAAAKSSYENGRDSVSSAYKANDIKMLTELRGRDVVIEGIGQSLPKFSQRLVENLDRTFSVNEGTEVSH